MEILTSIPQDVVADLKIKTYIVYDTEDKPICAYRRIDDSFSFECVTKEYLDKYNSKFAVKEAEKERKKLERQEKKLRNNEILKALETLSKEEQIAYLKAQLIKLEAN